MTLKNGTRFPIILSLGMLCGTPALLAPVTASAHCDTLNGPVVSAARKALKTGNINYALIWVKPKYETEIRGAFKETLAARKANAQVRKVADLHFFETVVRLHRAGEGAPYTGLKREAVDPGVAAADQAIASGHLDAVSNLLMQSVQQGLREHYRDLMAKKHYSPNDVRAGRRYVEAYVSYVHYVEGIYQAAKSPAHGHYAEGSVKDGDRETAHQQSSSESPVAGDASAC